MTLHPKVIDLSLGRMERILTALGNPERKLPPSVLIAGTNGKGSTQAMIRAGLEAEGLKVHAYTSPHLARFHERITVASETIGEDFLAEMLAECEAANGGAPITYFEITTAAAFLAYSRVPADFAVIEVGLGGRLDATNVISPDVCVITPVSRDHEQYLGNTIAAIAGEKAGILRPGVPAAIAPQVAEAEEVILATADRLGTPLRVGNRDWQIWEEHGRAAYQDGDGLIDLPLPRLIGAHQVVNAGTAITALKLLGRGNPERALTDAVWPARLQHLRRGPLVDLAGRAELWLDGGHNPAAGIALAEAVTRLSPRPLHLICGMLSTKDVEGYLRPLAGVAQSLHAVSIPGETATLPAAATAAAAARAGFSEVVRAEDVASAIRAITASAPDARILICGSLYLAGGVLRENG
ncbi:bifunctional folylpolyglutamate synthase/dihydrofolate synthase [Halovulum dunhuangense]|uniref:Dihydrofolate synthase/folylpolyglutamate synthase n=2 Tax=Halovulum dunhuangense TaxID=1505036 RepID=A0A849KXF1_9RHOB|nr:folylpolyglutamate synthase/dihydrofolate synthase family protein [Halovulum dunhuangense]NNU79217.1 bifunctional folylpolyglutamate synthase/dihydrofolate synthase [Halovulum dunhuangense]